MHKTDITFTDKRFYSNKAGLRTSHCGDFEPKPCTFQWRVARALEPFFEPIPLNWLKIKKMEPNVSHEDIVFMTS